MDLFAGRSSHGAGLTSARGCPMGGGIKRNKRSLPKGRSGVYGGAADPQPGDEQQGGWSRQQREEMDQRFTDAMARALRTGQEGPAAANATVSSRGRHPS